MLLYVVFTVREWQRGKAAPVSRGAVPQPGATSGLVMSPIGRQWTEVATVERVVF